MTFQDDFPSLCMEIPPEFWVGGNNWTEAIEKFCLDKERVADEFDFLEGRASLETFNRPGEEANHKLQGYCMALHDLRERWGLRK